MLNFRQTAFILGGFGVGVAFARLVLPTEALWIRAVVVAASVGACVLASIEVPPRVFPVIFLLNEGSR